MESCSTADTTDSTADTTDSTADTTDSTAMTPDSTATSPLYETEPTTSPIVIPILSVKKSEPKVKGSDPTGSAKPAVIDFEGMYREIFGFKVAFEEQALESDQEESEDEPPQTCIKVEEESLQFFS